LARGLTPRQLDVFRLVIEGKSNKVIARELDVSESTVKTHVQAIFERLEIGSRAQAVVVAARLGWQLPEPLR
jgi:DNA-binding NarL/FixJ family response regulator